MQNQFGVDKAGSFNANVNGIIDNLLNAAKEAKESVNNEVLMLQGEAPASTMADDPAMDMQTSSIHGRGWRKYDKLSHMVAPSPSNLWIFSDEHPDSINNGGFVLYPLPSRTWRNLPANYHNGGCGYAFADGHALTKKWADPVPKDEPVLKRMRLDYSLSLIHI